MTRRRFTLRKNGSLMTNLRVGITLTQEDYAELEAIAKRDDTTVNRLLEECLWNGLASLREREEVEYA